MAKFYSDLAFNNVEYAEEYTDKPKVDGVGYTFARKELDECNLIAVSVRGFEYRIQWADNFLVGEEGDHEGFYTSAYDVSLALDRYLGKINSEKPLKLWMSGYSRGGAIVNCMASQILGNNSAHVNQSNMYVYTFEAPRGLSKEHAVAYPNVLNVINSADIFTKICPEEYGLYRCGIDVDIYSSDFDNVIKTYDKDAVPAFKSSALYVSYIYRSHLSVYPLPYQLIMCFGKTRDILSITFYC